MMQLILGYCYMSFYLTDNNYQLQFNMGFVGSFVLLFTLAINIGQIVVISFKAWLKEKYGNKFNKESKKKQETN